MTIILDFLLPFVHSVFHSFIKQSTKCCPLFQALWISRYGPCPSRTHIPMGQIGTQVHNYDNIVLEEVCEQASLLHLAFTC